MRAKIALIALLALVGCAAVDIPKFDYVVQAKVTDLYQEMNEVEADCNLVKIPGVSDDAWNKAWHDMVWEEMLKVRQNYHWLETYIGYSENTQMQDMWKGVGGVVEEVYLHPGSNPRACTNAVGDLRATFGAVLDVVGRRPK